MMKIGSLKLKLSLAFGASGIFLLTMNFLLLYAGPPKAYPRTPLEVFKKNFYEVTEKLPLFFNFLLGLLTEGAFLIFLPLSLICIFLACKSLNSLHRKLTIFAIILNSINLIFSLFIAWLLFSLARGM